MPSSVPMFVSRVMAVAIIPLIGSVGAACSSSSDTQPDAGASSPGLDAAADAGLLDATANAVSDGGPAFEDAGDGGGAAATDGAGDTSAEGSVGPMDGAADATVEGGATGDAGQGSDGAAVATVGAHDCVEQIMGPTGGILFHPSGPRVVFPLYGLAAETMVSVCLETLAPGVNPGGALLGPAVLILPENASLYRPVTVFVPFDATRLPAGTDVGVGSLRTASSGSSTFTELETGLYPGALGSSVTHFGQFVPVQGAATTITASPSVGSATLGQAYSVPFSASGGTPPYTWSVASGSTTPAGLSISSAGVLSGVPSVPGSVPFTLEVEDAAHQAVQFVSQLYVVPATNPVPTLTIASPASLPQSSVETVIVLLGSFNPASGAMLDGTQALPAVFLGPQQLAVVIPAATLAQAAQHALAVSTPAPGGGTSASIQFAVTPLTPVPNPVPTIGFLSGVLPVSNAPLDYTMRGGGFLPTSVGSIGSQTLVTTYLDPTDLTVTIPAALLSAPGHVLLGITNPGPGGGTGNVIDVPVEVPSPQPTLTAVSPATVLPGSGPTTLTVTGTNFASGAALLFGNYSPSNMLTVVPLTVDSPTQAHGVVPAARLALADMPILYIANSRPPGGFTDVGNGWSQPLTSFAVTDGE